MDIAPTSAVTEPVRPTDIRLKGSQTAFAKLHRRGEKALEEVNVRLRGTRQQRRAALAELKKYGIEVEFGEHFKAVVPSTRQYEGRLHDG